jgi:DNA/RNA-binding domain of Phe-tRNA-synthetase-like protein
MGDLFYTISTEIFNKFPGYARGVVLAYDVENRDSPKELITLLRDAETAIRGQMKVESIAEHPRISAWREAYRSFGAKPSEFRSSVEAMARRVLRNEPIPSINALVDIGNVISLRHIVNLGGHAIDEVKENIELRPATGAELFLPFGSDQTESPVPGEIIFVEGNTVLTRRWTWRQANHTITLLSTRNIEFNVDGLPPVPISEVEEICDEVMDMVRRFCKGRTRYAILNRENPKTQLNEE